MSATVAAGLRIGEVAKRVGTTPRTIRYYEEIGILPSEGGRESGRHRLYGERDVQRLTRRAAPQGAARRQPRRAQGAAGGRGRRGPRCARSGITSEPGAERRREMLAESLRLIDRQLALVRRRRDEIAALEGELAAKRSLAMRRLRELGDE